MTLPAVTASPAAMAPALPSAEAPAILIAIGILAAALIVLEVYLRRAAALGGAAPVAHCSNGTGTRLGTTLVALSLIVSACGATNPIPPTATPPAQGLASPVPTPAATASLFEPLPDIPTDVPTPAQIAGGRPAEQAAALSGLLDGDRGGWLPALMRAYELAGYLIVDASDRPIGAAPVELTPTVGFWELWLLAGSEHGAAVTLSDWATMMRDTLEAGITDGGFADGRRIDAAELATAVLADIAAGVESDVPGRAFFAAFVSQRAATLGADPSQAGVSADDVWLDPVAFDLMSRAFATDILFEAVPDALAYEAAHASVRGGPSASGLASTGVPFPAPLTATLASWQQAGTVSFGTAQTTDDSFFAQCVPMSKLTAQGEDLIKTLTKVTFRGQSIAPSWLTKDLTSTRVRLPGVLDQLAANHPGTKPNPLDAEALAKRHDWVQKTGLPLVESLTDLVKIEAFRKGLRIAGTIDKVPLTRTYDAGGGQRGTITVELTFDPGGQEYLYCLDVLLRALGANLTLPQSGHFDAPVQLVPLGGFDRVDVDGAVVWRRAVMTTSGVVTAGVVGKPGDASKVDSKKPVPFTFSVRADVAMKESSFGKDWLDAFGTFAAGPWGIVKGIRDYWQRQSVFGMKVMSFAGRDFAGGGWMITDGVGPHDAFKAQAASCTSPSGPWHITLVGPLDPLTVTDSESWDITFAAGADTGAATGVEHFIGISPSEGLRYGADWTAAGTAALVPDGSGYLLKVTATVTWTNWGGPYPPFGQWGPLGAPHTDVYPGKTWSFRVVPAPKDICP